MKYKMFVFGLLLALVSSCDFGLPEQPIESAVAPENTLISKIATPTLEQHSMPFKINCPDLLDELPASPVFVGSLIMWGRDNNVPLMIMNLETGGQKTFSDQTYGISAGQLSPNRKWVAFQDTEALKLLLIDANGNLSEVTDWDKNWSGIITWLGNEQLLISETRESDLNPIGILNINTKEYRELGYDYPYHPKSWHERSPWLISTIYNPSMTQVVYPGFSVDHSESSLIVLDLQTEQIKAELPNYDNEAVSPPKWSPDGSKLLIPKENGEGNYFLDENHEEFFLIYNDGTTEQVTNFNDYYVESNIGYFNWSPNSRYVAFWFSDENQKWVLKILDTVTREINHCVISVSDLGFGFEPIWSPDGSALVVNRRGEEYRIDDGNTRFKNEVILIDIIDGYATIIVEDMYLSGWLVNEH